MAISWKALACSSAALDCKRSMPKWDVSLVLDPGRICLDTLIVNSIASKGEGINFAGTVKGQGAVL